MGKPTIAVIGTGALGGFYGGLLAKAGFEVHFLCRSDYQELRQHGLRVESKFGDFLIPKPLVYRDVDEMPACDLTILALKTTQNHQLEHLLPVPAGKSGLVLVLQNGLCPEADAAAIVGEERVIGGVCFLCSNKVGPGHIRHLDYGKIVVGEHRPADAPAPGVTPRLQQIVEHFRFAGIPIDATADQWAARWKKLMWNVPFNGLSVVLDAKSDLIVNTPCSAELAQSLMEEIRQAAEAHGRLIPQSACEEMMQHTRDMVPYDSSMRLDYLAQRPLEVEAIFGQPVRVAEALGQPIPRVRMLYEQLQFMDLRNRQPIAAQVISEQVG